MRSSRARVAIAPFRKVNWKARRSRSGAYNCFISSLAGESGFPDPIQLVLESVRG